LPYKSKAEQEAELWMTLPQAITHICGADHISEVNARRELLKALADDAFRSRIQFLVRWQDDARISGAATPDQIGPPDVPPRAQQWAQAKIRWASGKVRNDWGEYKHGKWRMVLVRRSTVLRLWPFCPNPEANAELGSSENSVSLSQRKSGGRPTARDQVYDALSQMRREEFNLRMPHKKLAEEVAKRNHKNLGSDRGWDERTIVEHISIWLRDSVK